MRSFKDLKVWQKSHALALEICVVVRAIRRVKPKLADQMERAATGIPALIAEGRGRSTDKDFAEYITKAISEANELENHIQLGYDEECISEQTYTKTTDDTIEVRKMPIGFRHTLRG